MNKHLHPFFTASLCALFTYSPVNAQTHSNQTSITTETLSPARLAFLSCYNSVNKPEKHLPSAQKSESTSVENQKNDHSLKTANIATDNVCIFPNRTEDELWVEVDAKKLQSNNLHLEIYNAGGEIVYRTRVQQDLNKISVCDFTAGTFLVKLGDVVQKMIIE